MPVETILIDSFFCQINLSVNNDFRVFLRATLQESILQRPTAEQCLNFDFFTKYEIPKKLSLEMSPILSFSENTIISTMSFFKGTSYTPIETISYRFIPSLSSI